MRLLRTASFLLVASAGLPVLAWAEFRSVSVAGRVSFDAGTVFVPGVAKGIGGGVGLRVAFGDNRGEWVLGVDGDIAGFVGAGDGDPILQLAGSFSRRGFFGDDGGTRRFWVVGAGAGLVGIAGPGTAFPLKVGLGVALGERGGLDVMVFNRFTSIYGGGDPAFDFINSTGVELALRLGR